jgi:hypothetical protein
MVLVALIIWTGPRGSRCQNLAHHILGQHNPGHGILKRLAKEKTVRAQEKAKRRAWQQARKAVKVKKINNVSQTGLVVNKEESGSTQDCNAVHGIRRNIVKLMILKPLLGQVKC